MAMVINPTFDGSITSDPNAAAIEATINRTIAAYKGLITDNVTVDITFKEMTSGLGQSNSTYYFIDYKDYRAALVSHATTADDNTAIASLPSQTNNPVNNDPQVRVKAPLGRALGFNTPGGGTISLNTSICNIDRTSAQGSSKYDLQAVIAHEIDEVIGFGSRLDNLNNGDPTPTGNVAADDLFRYDENGARSFSTSATAQAYFSIDGGATDLARFNQHEGGDFGDWYSYYGGQTPQVQDAYNTPAATANLDAAELTRLDVLGFTTVVHAPQVTAAADQTAVEGASKSFDLGSFTDPDAAPWGVTVSWGDGSPDATFFLNGAGSLGSRTHKFVEEGNYTVTVTVTDFTSQSQSKTYKVSVSDPSVVGTSVPVYAVDCRTVTVTTATFTDPGGPEPLADYSASIDWGDGTSASAGTISYAAGVFTVKGTHSYASHGNYTITTTIKHEASTPTVVKSAATITDDIGLLLLDPWGTASLRVDNNGQVLVNGCGAVVVDSDASRAAVVVKNGVVAASQLHVTGGLHTSGNAVVTPAVEHDAPVADPLGLGAPSPKAPFFGAVDDVLSGPLALTPGTYLGGIHVGGNAVVTLAPGVYYMAGGGFSVDGNGSVSGDDVVIVNLPVGPWAPVDFREGARVDLSARESGPLKGIVIFQAPYSGLPLHVGGDAQVDLAGVVYAPGAAMKIDGDGVVTINAGPGTATLPPIDGALIAYDLYVANNGKLIINPDPPAPLAAEMFSLASADATDAAIDALDQVSLGLITMLDARKKT